MTAAEWGKSLMLAGLMILVVAALMYAIWPDWMANLSILTRLGAALLMGGAGAIAAALGILLVANNAR